MSDKKITQLTAVTLLADTDLFVVVDDVAGTPTSKKLSAADLAEYIAASATVLAALTTDFADADNVLANAVFS